jgi:DNA-binding transcriptional LysR family regulator
MELRQLRAFIEVASAGHYGRAAERLHISQPALSQRIQALEREIGLPLLQRSAREVRLAPAGTALLPHAQRMVQVEDQVLHDVKAYLSGVVGRLRLAYQSAGDMTLAGSIIAEFRRRFPRVEVETIAGTSGTNLKLVQEHAADAAFVMMPSPPPDGVAARPIRREEVILALRLDHHLAAMDPIPVEALRGEPIALPPSAANPDLIATMRRWLVRQTGAELNVVSEDPTDLAVETVARLGAAVLMLRRSAMMRPAIGIAFRSISPAPLVELAIAYGSGERTQTLTNLLQVVEELSPLDAGEVPQDGELI